MATPAFQAVGASDADIVAGVTPLWPIHQAGDVALLFTETQGGYTPTLTTAAGFVSAGTPATTGTAGAGTQLSVWWCRATSSAMTNPVFGAPTDHVLARIMTVRGCKSSGNPIDAYHSAVKAATSTVVTYPAVTTSTDNCFIVGALTQDTDVATGVLSTQTNANLTNITPRINFGTTVGNGGGFGIWTADKATAGDTGTTSGTLAYTSINAMVTLSLTSTVLVAGTIGAYNTLSGALTQGIACPQAGAFSITTSISGTISGGLLEAGTLTVPVGVTGTLARTFNETGTVTTVTSIADANVIITVIGEELFYGALSLTASVSGALTVTLGLHAAGTIVTQLAVSGAIVKVLPAAAIIGLQTNVSGTLSFTGGLHAAGTASVTTSLTGTTSQYNVAGLKLEASLSAIHNTFTGKLDRKRAASGTVQAKFMFFGLNLTSIGVIPDPNGFPPRMVITVNVPGINLTNISRTHPDGSIHPVRLTQGTVLNGGLWNGYDYEAPFGVPVVYTAETTHDLVMSPAVSLDVQGAWLCYPGNPTGSQPLLIQSVGDKTRAVTQGVFRAIGRPDAIVVSDRRQSAEWAMTVATRSLQERDDLLTLTDTGAVLLINCSPDSGYDIPWAYVSVGSIVENRPARLITEPIRFLTLPLTETSMPVGLESAPYVWGDMLVEFSSWANVRKAFHSWSDAIAQIEWQ